MKKIDLATYKRRDLFHVFKDRDIPYFSTTAHVDITDFKHSVDSQALGFFVPFSFLLSITVNGIPELRQRIIEGELFEFEQVDPGYTVLLEDETFCFCDSRHFTRFVEYRPVAEAAIRKAKECPDHSTGDKSHMFFITSLPWFSFTSITHPYTRAYGSIPIVTMGKYFQQAEKLLMPVGIQVHHGVVDGIHVGRFYQQLSEMCANPAAYLGV